MTSLAKPISVGSRVRITSGKLEGQTGVVVKLYPARHGTPARVSLKLERVEFSGVASVWLSDVEVVA